MELVKITVKFARDLQQKIESERAERAGQSARPPKPLELPAAAQMTVTKDVATRKRAKYERKIVDNGVGQEKRLEETLRVVFLRPKITEQIQKDAIKYTQTVKMAPKKDN